MLCGKSPTFPGNAQQASSSSTGFKGTSPGATDTVCYDIDLLELERVDADHFEGWDVVAGRIAFCHTGYRPVHPKQAIASGVDIEGFSLVRTSDKACIETLETLGSDQR